MMLALAPRISGRYARSRGVALITALLVVALATTAAVAMVSRQQLDIRRTENILRWDQGWLYGLGVEDWAAQVLRRDREDGEVDTLSEDWATVLPPIPVEGGQIAGQIEDLQGRFNINNLITDKGAPSPADVEIFRRLLAVLELEPALATAVIDWLDADIDAAFPDGAEDDTYLGRDTPYRAANSLMISPSELLLVEGMTTEAYQALLPHVAALPARTRINVNTASAPVLMALGEGLTEADAQALIEGRGDEGFASLEDFLKQEALAGRKIDSAGLGVSTDYFIVNAMVQMGRFNLRLNNVLYRESNGATRSILRAQGTY